MNSEILVREICREISILIFIITLVCIFRDYLCKNPDLILRKQDGTEYLRRWWLIPRNRFGFNIYLHKFMSSDEDRSLHDHPWWTLSILLSGCYLEHMPKNMDKWVHENNREEVVKKRYPFIPIYRSADAIHRIELINETPVWTLFITGPVIREWGFYCPTFWRHHNDFLDPTGKTKGKGCN